MTDVERKIRLTRFLREESLKNQVRIRNREEILYGNGRRVHSLEEFPGENGMFYDDSIGQCAASGGHLFSGLKIRIFLAFLVFILCIYLDLNGTAVLHSLPEEWIMSTLNWSTEAKLIDFISTFPYTLSDKQ